MKILMTVRLTACCGLLTTALSLSGWAQKGMNSFTINGSFVNMTAPEKVYLAYDTAHYQPTDSAVVTNGKYTFHGKTDGVSHLFISKKWWDRRAGGWELSVPVTDRAELFVEKGTVEVVSGNGDMEKSVIKGSPVDKDYREANHHLTLLGDTLRPVFKMAKEANNIALQQKLMSQAFSKIGEIMKGDYIAYVHQHPASPINVYLLSLLARLDDRTKAGWIDSIAGMYHALSVSVRTGMDGQAFGRFLDNELRTAVGHLAPDFTENDAQGHAVSLSSLRGKYVFLDFWSSGDGNAAQALPAVAKIYENYGSKGLVVLGVSLDKDKASWQQAIQEGGVGSTMQVSDLNGPGNAAARLYGVTKLPFNLLIDPSGVIVAKGLTSLNLDKTLSSIFE